MYLFQAMDLHMTGLDYENVCYKYDALFDQKTDDNWSSQLTGHAIPKPI